MRVGFTPRQLAPGSVLVSNTLMPPASDCALGATWEVGQTGVIFSPLLQLSRVEQSGLK